MTRGSAAAEPRPALALTMGEPAGIGGELALMAWRDRVACGVPAFFLIDDPERLSRLAERLGLNVPLAELSSPDDAAASFYKAIGIDAHQEYHTPDGRPVMIVKNGTPIAELWS